LRDGGGSKDLTGGARREGRKGPTSRAVAHVDGASRGNPGPAACGVILSVEGLPCREIGLYLGETTNNVAEYCGLILALREARAEGVTDLTVISDSQLMVSQVNGEFKVSSEKLAPLHQKVTYLKSGFASFSMKYVPREENTRADRLTDRVLKLAEDIRPQKAGE
jgi:ribonuclease HI